VPYPTFCSGGGARDCVGGGSAGAHQADSLFGELPSQTLAASPMYDATTRSWPYPHSPYLATTLDSSPSQQLHLEDAVLWEALTDDVSVHPLGSGDNGSGHVATEKSHGGVR
jgi:hypothetical protein